MKHKSISVRQLCALGKAQHNEHRHDDIIARMEAMQQRFGTPAKFPSLLQSAENERRLKLTDKEDRTFDGEDAEAWQEQSERQGAE